MTDSFPKPVGLGPTASLGRMLKGSDFQSAFLLALSPSDEADFGKHACDLILRHPARANLQVLLSRGLPYSCGKTDIKTTRSW